MIPPNKTLAGTYENLVAERYPYLRRAYDTAMLTLPHLIVQQERGESSRELPTPYQSVGARGVASLSSKLLLTLVPPNAPFFRYKVDPGLQLPAEVQTEVESSLKDRESAVLTEMETSSIRPYIHEALKQLVNGGNCVFHVEENSYKVHKLNQYVCKRDPEGQLKLLIIREYIAPGALPEEVRETITGQSEGKLDDSVPIYTGAVWREEEKHWEVYQEVGGMRIEEGAGTYKKDDLPFLVLRMEPVTGESYGYGYASGYLGDLKSLEGLSQALLEGTAAAAKVVFLVDPMAETKAEDLAKAPNGAIRPGREQDVTVVQTNKQNDFRIADAAIDRLTRNLGFAFLLNQSIQRKGERVTAEEIRLLAQELEDVLAGTYSLLSAEFQLPLVRLLEKRMVRQNRIPLLPEKTIEPTIVTGLEALGRGHDLVRLQTWVAQGQQMLGEEFLKYTKAIPLLQAIGNYLGLKVEPYMNSEAEVAQIEQQEQLAAAASTFGPEAFRTAATNIKAQQAQTANG